LHGGDISGHASHENGLDVDIAYFRNDHSEQDPEITSGFIERFVRNGKLSANFDLERNWTFIKALTRTGRISRIFTDRVIKNALCRYAESLGELKTEEEALRRLRHWPNHTDHWHVRLTCPEKSPRCKAQDDPPPGSGCGRAASEWMPLMDIAP